MKNELLFYNRSEFAILREIKKIEGYSISSITEYIKDNSLISICDHNTQIVDLSSLGTLYLLNDIQYLGEEVLRLFGDDIIFIADKKHRELLEYELRYCFLFFKDIEPDYSKLSDEFDDDIKHKTDVLPKTHRLIIDLNDDELKEFHQDFNKNLYGHDKFKDDFIDLINSFRVFNKIGEHKILSLFLLGESGVGKTEVARTIYKCLGGKKKLAKVNFGNYSSEFSLSSLIGSARGYIGSEDGEIFIRTRNTDVGVLLIDEFEKSNATLFNYFLDVLESGKIISSLAEEIDLNGFIIVFTSNIPKEDFQSKISPELRSRFDYKCQFTVLYDEDKKMYAEFRVNDIINKVNEKFETTLPANSYNELMSTINVSKFNNMRDLNKKIKRAFIEYLINNPVGEKMVEEQSNQISFTKKVLKLFSLK
jgi:ATP-dependent Clp protease ATP-binding subunit ClpC